MVLAVLRVAIVLLSFWIITPLVVLGVLLLFRWRYNIYMMQKWKTGRVPVEDDLRFGQYRVTILPRALFFWFLNVKRIALRPDGQYKIGENLAYGLLRWGKFSVYCREEGLCLNYHISGFPFSRVRDVVREIGEGVFLGRFNLLYRGRYIFVFWFMLSDWTAAAGDGDTKNEM